MFIYFNPLLNFIFLVPTFRKVVQRFNPQRYSGLVEEEPEREADTSVFDPRHQEPEN